MIKIWRLKAKEERRFKQGHPWVYSNELQESPKGIEFGQWIELHSASGDFLAFGFGNPHSLISFRELTRERWFEDRTIPEAELSKKITAGLVKTLSAALDHRLHFFKPDQSFRFVFGEVDGLPGLVIDRYAGTEGKTVYAIQLHAAGMDAHLDLITLALTEVLTTRFKKDLSILVYRFDAGSRIKDGLEKLPTRVCALEGSDLEELSNTDFLKDFSFRVGDAVFRADLLSGQKTGFFLDQQENIRRVGYWMNRLNTMPHQLKILDLCSYVGQWSTQLVHARLASYPTAQLDVACVDASDAALQFAETNVRHSAPQALKSGSLRVRRVKADVIEPAGALLGFLQNEKFNVVIADPPALIKSRKDIPQGKQAYVQIMSEAMKRTAPGGLVVCCSCSQLLSADDFTEILAKAARKALRKVRFIDQGAASPDHPERMDFHEGAYLKMRLGVVE